MHRSYPPSSIRASRSVDAILNHNQHDTTTTTISSSTLVSSRSTKGAQVTKSRRTSSPASRRLSWFSDVENTSYIHRLIISYSLTVVEVQSSLMEVDSVWKTTSMAWMWYHSQCCAKSWSWSKVLCGDHPLAPLSVLDKCLLQVTQVYQWRFGKVKGGYSHGGGVERDASDKDDHWRHMWKEIDSKNDYRRIYVNSSIISKITWKRPRIRASRP